MPASCNISKEAIIKKAVVMINKKGWDSLNARDLAKELKISTKPLLMLNLLKIIKIYLLVYFYLII